MNQTDWVGGSVLGPHPIGRRANNWYLHKEELKIKKLILSLHRIDTYCLKWKNFSLNSCIKRPQQKLNIIPQIQPPSKNSQNWFTSCTNIPLVLFGKETFPF